MNYMIENLLFEEKYECPRAILFVLSLISIIILSGAYLFDSTEAICMIKKVTLKHDYFEFLSQFGVIMTVSGLFSLIMFGVRASLSVVITGLSIFLFGFFTMSKGIGIAICSVGALVFLFSFIWGNPKVVFVAVMTILIGCSMKSCPPIPLNVERSDIEMYGQSNDVKWLCNINDYKNGESLEFEYTGTYDNAVKYFKQQRVITIKEKRKIYSNYFIREIETNSKNCDGTIKSDIGIYLVPRKEALANGDLERARRAERIALGKID